MKFSIYLNRRVFVMVNMKYASCRIERTITIFYFILFIYLFFFFFFFFTSSILLLHKSVVMFLHTKFVIISLLYGENATFMYFFISFCKGQPLWIVSASLWLILSKRVEVCISSLFRFYFYFSLGLLSPLGILKTRVPFMPMLGDVCSPGNHIAVI